MRNATLTLMALAALAMTGCNQSTKPETGKPIGYVETWLSKLPGYQFHDSTVTEGTYQGEHAWIVDYKFKAQNGFGIPIPCHTTVYVRADRWDGDPPKSYFEENQANEEALMQKYQENLAVNITKKEYQGSYLYVYGSVTNNNSVAIKSVDVNLAGFNAAKEIVSDGMAYVASGEYLKPGQTGYFKEMMTDESQEIVSVEATAGKVYSFSIAKQSEN
jgi:hypothetical protein